MNKTIEVTLCALLISLPALAQSGSSTKPRHCSVEGASKELPYPDSMRGSGIQGTILLEAIVSQSGCTDSVRVIRKLNPELDEIAKASLNSWKLKPATKDGKPVKVIVQIEVSFRDPGK